MYRGFMRVVIDETQGEIIPLIHSGSGSSNSSISATDSPASSSSQSPIISASGDTSSMVAIIPNLDKNVSLVEYQYVPTVKYKVAMHVGKGSSMLK